METLGSLTDKISIVNIKIWHLEDRRNDKTLPDGDRLKAADELTVQNRLRRKLCQEIDEQVKKVIETGNVPVLEQVSL